MYQDGQVILHHHQYLIYQINNTIIMGCRQVYFLLKNAIGSATGSYTMVDNNGDYIFYNKPQVELLSGVTYSINDTAYNFHLTNRIQSGNWSACNTTTTTTTSTTTTTTTAAPNTDIKMLLHLDGTNGQTSGLIDSSTFNYPVQSRNGASITTSTSKFGSASGNLINVTNAANQYFTGATYGAVGTYSLSVDLWIKSAGGATTSQTQVGYRTVDAPGDPDSWYFSVWQLGPNSTRIWWHVRNTNAGPGVSYIVYSCDFTNTTQTNWHHYAFQLVGSASGYTSGSWGVWFDGSPKTLGITIDPFGNGWNPVMPPQQSCSLNVGHSSYFGWGGNSDYGDNFDEVRVIIGNNTYTPGVGFTPPAAPY